MFRFPAVLAASILCCAAVAQQPKGPAFEVATVKPAAPPQMGPKGPMMMMGIRGGPGTNDPGQWQAMGMPLSRLIAAAYNVRNYQVSGPSWMDSERFDITAKVPPGTTKEQFYVMLQNLLAERFKLVVHKESKDGPVYALVVAKGGVKMKESPKIDPATDGDTPPPPPKIGPDGMPSKPMGRGGRGMGIMIGPKGLRMQGSNVTMERLSGVLSEQLGRPVVDKTGLTGEYDISMDFSPEGLPGMRGMPVPPPGAGPDGPRGGGPDVGEGAPSLFTAIQDLGLKLESRKAPVDLIVVDSAEKTPVEN